MHIGPVDSDEPVPRPTQPHQHPTVVGVDLDSGVTFFDTADGYAGGESKMLLGRALLSRRDSVVIATKVGFRTGPALTQAGLSRRHISWSVDQSSNRLGTD